MSVDVGYVRGVLDATPRMSDRFNVITDYWRQIVINLCAEIILLEHELTEAKNEQHSA